MVGHDFLEMDAVMSVELVSVLAKQVEGAVRAAGLEIAGLGSGTDFSGDPTLRFQIARPELRARVQQLEMSAGMDVSAAPELRSQLSEYLEELAKRLKNPRPDCYLTLHGIAAELWEVCVAVPLVDLGCGYVPGAWRGPAGGRGRRACCMRSLRRR